MPVFKNSDLHKRLTKSAGGYGGFDLSPTQMVYSGSENSQPDTPAPDTRSNWQKFIDLRHNDRIKAIGESLSSAYKTVGNTLGTIAADVSPDVRAARQAHDSYQKSTLQLLSQLNHTQFDDPNATPEQKKRAHDTFQKVYAEFKQNSQDYQDPNAGVKDLSVKKFGGAEASIVGDILSAGTYGTAAKGAKTGELLRAGEAGANVAERSVLKTAAKGAGIGAATNIATDIPQQVTDNHKGVNWGELATQGGLGAVLGALGGTTEAIKGNRATRAADAAVNASQSAIADEMSKVPYDQLIGKKIDVTDLSKTVAGKVATTGDKQYVKEFNALSKEYDQRTKALADVKSPVKRTALQTQIEDEFHQKMDALDAKYGTTKVTFPDKGGTAPAAPVETPTAAPTATPTTPNEPATLADAMKQTEQSAPAAAPTVPGAPTPKTFAPPSATADLPKKDNILKRMFTSERGKLSSMGAEGQQVADGLQKMRDNSETAQQAFIKQIPTVTSLKKKDFGTFVDTLDKLSRGETMPNVPAHIQKAVTEWQRIIPTVRDAAVKAGVDVGNLGENYFPRNYTELLSNKKGFQSAVDHLVKTGQAQNSVEAANMLHHMRAKYNTAFGHFDNSRTVDLPNYDKSKNALTNYIEGAFNKISHAEQFGAKGEKAAALIDTIGKTKGDLAKEQALRSYMVSTGTYKWDRPDALLKSYSAIRAFNRVRALGLSALMNAGQTTNTASVSGIWNTSKAALKLLSKPERQYVHDTGVVIDSVLGNLRKGSGAGNDLLGKITAPGFNKVENFNRMVAAEAGKNWANKLAKKAARGDAKAISVLRDKLGIEGEIGAKLTQEQQVRASRRLVELTQFKVDPQDLPGWMSSPEGKMVSQFRTFAYKQTGFIYNQVLGEAAKGNVAPLVRFLAVGVPIGYVTGYTRSALSGKNKSDVQGVASNPKHSLTHDLIGALQNVGAFGMGSDLAFLGSNVKSQRFPQYLASSVAGPTAGLALETATNVQQAAAGNPTALERQGVKSVPIAGRYLQNQLVPYKSTMSPTQKQFISDGVIPQQHAQDYANFFQQLSDMPQKKTGKTGVSTQIKAAVDNHQFNKARRIADQYNGQVDQYVQQLSTKTGTPPPEVLQYIKDNYTVSYDYYVKNRNRKKR